MHLLYTDETNIDPTNTEVFVYAGVAIDGARAASLSQEITHLRAAFKYQPNDPLKFNTVERPTHISPEAHADIKRRVMEVAAKHDVRLLASMILHSIAKDPADARIKEINRVCYHFDCYLNRIKDSGLVLLDTFTDQAISGHLREKFAIGITGHLPFSKTLPMRNILGYHLASLGSSHFCSLIDIVLGALRFAINNRRDQARANTVTAIMAQLAPLCYREASGKVSEIGLFFSPKQIKSAKFHSEYVQFQDFFKAHGMESGQDIRHEPSRY